MTTAIERQYDYARTWTSAAQSVYAMLQYTDKRSLSLVDVMGFTGLAFRINIDARDVNVAAPTGWQWQQVLPEGLLRLGVKSRCLGQPNHTSPTPEELVEAIVFIKDSINRQVPVVGWDLFVGEFGIIHGYDDEKKVFLAKDVSKEGELPYEQLGRNEGTELFILRMEDSNPIDFRNSLHQALQSAVDHARQARPELESRHFRHGLNAYDAWMEVFHRKEVDPFGNSYCTSIVRCAREYAVRFLLDQSSRWEGNTQVDEAVRQHMIDAAHQYAKVADALSQLQHLYPFPQGGTPNNSEIAGHSVTLLGEAKRKNTALNCLKESYS